MRTMLVLLMAVSGFAGAQTPKSATAPPPLVGAIAGHAEWPKAKTADVDSVEHIVQAVYDVISGGAGEARDWERMRSLFVPDARLVPIQATRGGAGADVVFLTVDAYIARSKARTATAGFFERSLHNEVEQFGNLVQVWSTYASRHAAADAEPFARGINSFQLVKDGDRYWVVQILWDSEKPGTPIPEKYLR